MRHAFADARTVNAVYGERKSDERKWSGANRSGGRDDGSARCSAMQTMHGSRTGAANRSARGALSWLRAASMLSRCCSTAAGREQRATHYSTATKLVCLYLKELQREACGGFGSET